MTILGLDAGATTGSAILDGDHLTDLRVWRRMDEAAGRALFAAWLHTLHPTLIVVERPSNPGSRWSADGVEQLGERAGELVGMCEVIHPGIHILRPWPQPQKGEVGWQPWAHAGFVGGDDQWKERTVHHWRRRTDEMGAYCHVGRVNTARRLDLCAFYEVDSIDGSGASRFSVHAEKMERWRSEAEARRRLFP